MNSVLTKVVVELGADVIVFGGVVPDGAVGSVDNGVCGTLEPDGEGAPDVDEPAVEEGPPVDDEPDEPGEAIEEALTPELPMLLPVGVAERPVLPPDPVNETPLGAEVAPDVLEDAPDPIDGSPLAVELGEETPLPLLLLPGAVPGTPVLPPDPVNDTPLGTEDETDTDALLKGADELGDPLAWVLLANSEAGDETLDEDRDGLYVDEELPPPGNPADALASPVPVVSRRLLPPLERIPIGGTGEDAACSNTALQTAANSKNVE